MKYTKDGNGLNTSTVGVDKSFQSQILPTNVGKLFDLLSDPYQNPIGSIVREITSNCFDSHREAGVEDAVVVAMDRDGNGEFISFTDVGVGLSPERIETVYVNYLSSTKENSNDFLGYFGLGSKSPLSYQEQFFIKTRYDGTEYHYIMHKTEQAPEIELLYTLPTAERNGTEIKIYIKPGDWQRFQDEVQDQLTYFENIYFQGCGTNNYTIYEGENFLYRPDSPHSSYLHLCLGKVAYPIDFNVIKRPFISLPFALKFDIGDIMVTLNREGLKYTNDAIEKINKKIDALFIELRDRYNKQAVQIDDVLSYLDMRGSTKYIKIGGDQIILSNISGLTGLNEPVFGPLPDVDIPITDPFFEYHVTGRFTGKKIIAGASNSITYLLKRGEKLVRIVGESDPLKNKYIYDLYDEEFFFLRKRETSLHSYRLLLGLKRADFAGGYKKSKARDIICRYQKAMLEQLIKYTDRYADIEIDQQWLKEYKQGKLKSKVADPRLIRKANKQIFAKQYNTTNSESIDLNLISTKGKKGKKGLEDMRCMIVYGSHDDRSELRGIARILNNRLRLTNGYEIIKSKALVLSVAKSNFEHFEEHPTAIHWTKFMKGDSRIFKKIVTAMKIGDFTKNINLYMGTLELVAPDIVEKVRSLQKFVEDNNAELRGRGYYVLQGQAKTDLLTFVEENNLFDEDIMQQLDEINRYFEDVKLLKYITVQPTDEEGLKAIAEYLRWKKKKVKPEYYFKMTPVEEQAMRNPDGYENYLKPTFENLLKFKK